MTPSAYPIAVMGIDENLSALINEACTGAVGRIDVKELDKGLSGAKVLLAQWPLKAQTTSALHVLKIHTEISKLQDEMSKIEELVAPVDPQIGHVKFFQSSSCGLLRQAFIGSPEGELQSLRNWFEIARTTQEARKIIADLFEKRMRQWHCGNHRSPPQERHSYTDMFKGRTYRIKDLSSLLDQLGTSALAKSFEKLSNLKLAPLEKIVSGVDRVCLAMDEFPIGLTHGDLHSQNVLIGQDQAIHLIDFAWADYRWKAVDFLMLECSLKFLVAPLDARDEDLVEMESLIEDSHAATTDFELLLDKLHGNQLRVFAAALSEIRKQALTRQAIRDMEQYRRGLIVLMACLARFPKLNRTFLAHSLAFHAARI